MKSVEPDHICPREPIVEKIVRSYLREIDRV